MPLLLLPLLSPLLLLPLLLLLQEFSGISATCQSGKEENRHFRFQLHKDTNIEVVVCGRSSTTGTWCFHFESLYLIFLQKLFEIGKIMFTGI